MMVRKPVSKKAATRKPNLREAILCAAEELFATNGFNAISIRDIARAAGANPGSVTYHFKTKDGLLLEIYRRHCVPMNCRRSELLAAATRVRAVMSAEGNEVARKIIAQTFDDTSHGFIDAIQQSLPHISRNEIVWRS